MQSISQYLNEIQNLLKTGDAREHAYRPAFQKLIESIVSDIQAINEPAYTGGNAPDFLFKKGSIPIAYAECKDISVNINDDAVQKQANRYVEAFGKILLTNYFDFQIINEDGTVITISIAEKTGNDLVPVEKEFEKFSNLVRDYITPSSRTIRSAKKLAEIMAGKARLLHDNALAALSEIECPDICNQYNAFKEILVKDLSKEEFSDMYAQTLVYGLFVARYFDTSLNNFSRHEASELLPSTNPFLRKFFGHIAGPEFDPKIAWIIDDLVEAYKGVDLQEIMRKEFENKQKDPVLHFYETFLSEYDKSLRKKRGVYYTPEPVVSFIVRAVDDILKSEFGLSKGLVDTTKIEHEFTAQGTDGRTKTGEKKVKQQIHKVQVLDPAVGTGTFLNEVINQIYGSFKGQEGLWQSYVQEHLLPRIHGFELMMASYTMAHLKLGIKLNEFGYKGNDRLSVWLTNSLEESVHEVPNLFMANWLTEESNQASRIKSEMPIMVILGNPPYSGTSSNETEYANSLVEKYKVEPGGKEKLKERKHWLNDDYVKFIALAEHFIEQNTEGVVSFITNHGYIENPTFRGMRWHLRNTFDKIYVIDLHGNSNKKETALDGSKDENVFDIKTGVSIILAIKKQSNKNNDLARIYKHDLRGLRKDKFAELDSKNIDTIQWVELPQEVDSWVLEGTGKMEYQKGFSVAEIFPKNSTGIVTMGDSFIIDENKDVLAKRVNDFLQNDISENELKNKYELGKNYGKWIIENKQKIINDHTKILPLAYRPFDTRYTYFDNNLVWRPRTNVMQHFMNKENVGLIFTKQVKAGDIWCHVNVSDKIIESSYISNKTGEINSIAPLYLYSESDEKFPNLNKEILSKLSEIVVDATPENILDYIYAVLHSPSYREKYKEFLKIDFPRVPYPKDKKQFDSLVVLGGELREIHLLESPKVSQFVTTFPVSGDNIIEKKFPLLKETLSLTGHPTNPGVYINEQQYFGLNGIDFETLKKAWDFYIGGYQPAQKWLKDRRGRQLSVEDIQHYQKIMVALTETDRIMKEIDKIDL